MQDIMRWIAHLNITEWMRVYFGHNALAIEVLMAVILGTILVWFFGNLVKESRDDRPGENLSEIEDALRRVLDETGTPMTASQATGLIKDEDDLLKNVKIDFPLGGTPAVGAAAPAPAAMPAAAAPAAAAPSAPAPAPVAAAPAAPAPAAPAPVAPPPGADPAELAKLKSEVDVKSKKLSELEQQLQSAKDELNKAKTVTESGQTGGLSKDQEQALQSKIRDLEAKLGEYEIIEDDIANLSIYKEENALLKNELERMKTSTPAAAAAPAPAPAAPQVAAPPPPEPEPPPAPEPEPEPEPAPTPAPVVEAKAPEPAPAPAAAPEPAPAAEAKTEKPIDADKLLAEFQAMATTDPQTPAATTEGDSGEKLIAEFENFMKGSGGG